jgi:hexosaminidase
MTVSNFQLRRLAFVALLLCAALPQAVHPATPPLSLIPAPASVERTPGRFMLRSGARLAVRAGDGATLAIARQFAKRLAHTRGISLEVRASAGVDAVIRFVLDPAQPIPGDQFGEGYTLSISPRRIVLAAPTAHGLFNGSITLWQLLTTGSGAARELEVPCATIRDYPRFAWRGVMLDSVRHMQSVARIEALLEQMALHKLNVLHWHLTDDQGWRIQIRRYPRLTDIGAWRTPPATGHDGEPERYGGFYTQDEIRKVVAYAAARDITIVPELDMPGHAQAAIASYPRIGVTGKRPGVSTDWGVNPWLYNVDDDTFTFIDNVLDEVLALFPSRYVHVGGDEAIKDQWRASTAVQKKMKALGIDDENALQGWFIGRIGRYLKAHGRKLIGWDEILDGDGLPADATVMSWRGTDGAIKAALLGHDVVMAPSPVLYFDHVQSDLADEYAGRLGVESLHDVYAFQAVPGVLSAAQARHVLGVQANLWTEHLPTMAHVEHAAFPRLDALAEVAWSPAARLDWRDFLARLPAQFARYRAQHIDAADSAFAVAIDTDRNVALATGKAMVTLSDQTGFGTIRYTLDGSLPTAVSTRYAAPFTVALPATVRATSFTDDGSALAAPRERILSRAALLSLPGTELANCPGSDFRLRVQPTPDATSTQPVYAINVFDTCQQFPPTLLDGVHAIHVRAARIERNYALAHEQNLVVPRPHTTRFGELVVHADACDGKVLATMPLPDPARSARVFDLEADLPALSGEHGLCLIYTAPIDGPLYALGRVSLIATP